LRSKNTFEKKYIVERLKLRKCAFEMTQLISKQLVEILDLRRKQFERKKAQLRRHN
jgi:hypothetical protein